MSIGTFVAGLVCGIGLTAAIGVFAIPKLMLVTHKSKLGFKEALEALEKAIADHGWSSPGTIDLCASMEKHGVECPRRVAVVQMCHPEYAKEVLTTHPHVSALMPCAIAVWESEDGAVHFSKMNTGLMGKFFGGTIAKVMGGKVSKDEQAILRGIAEHA